MRLKEHWNVDIIESLLLTSEHIYAVVRQCSTPEKNLMGFSTHYMKSEVIFKAFFNKCEQVCR